jgi:hypothetical protein
MVIFGAGASHDSAQAFPPRSNTGGPWRPPLAKDLFLDPNHFFGEYVRNYPKLTHILPYLRQPPAGKSVEEVLEDVVEQGKTNPETLRELASVRFYLCDLLHNISARWLGETDRATNYATLVREILRLNGSGEEICLVTFNYDMLLEHALYSFDFKDLEPAQFLESHPILKLFKLHGSVNWGRLVAMPDGSRLTPQALIEQADTIRLTDEFVRVLATDPTQMFNFRKPVFPAIAIPVQTKSAEHFECPASHREHLTQMLDRVSKILVIGWQAKEAHFLKMLQNKVPLLQHVMVVGASDTDAKETLRHFLGQLKKQVSNVAVGQGGFTNFIVNREGESFFHS